jgi:hypothetical protein
MVFARYLVSRTVANRFLLGSPRATPSNSLFGSSLVYTRLQYSVALALVVNDV